MSRLRCTSWTIPLKDQIMLFGYPVEMLCNYQYSLVSLIPGEHHL